MKWISMVVPLIMLTAGMRCAVAGDWPMWRNDAARSAASAHELPESLHLQWSRSLAAIAAAWPNEARLDFDGAYEPIVAGQLLLVGSPLDGSLTAYETATGEQRWKFFTEGPVRFAPVAWEGKVFVGSDDGHVYCLQANDGALPRSARGPARATASRQRPAHLLLAGAWWPRTGRRHPVLRRRHLADDECLRHCGRRPDRRDDLA